MSDCVDLNELKKEYIRTRLFGRGRNLQRRGVTAIVADLQGACGDVQVFIETLEEEIKGLEAAKAELLALVQQGLGLEAPQIIALISKTMKKYGNLGCQYLQNAVAAQTAKPEEHAAEDAIPEFPQSWQTNTYAPDSNRFNQIMFNYCVCGLWDASKTQKAIRESFIQKLRQLHQDKDIDQALKIADAWLEAAKPLAQEALARQQDSPQQVRRLKNFKGPLYYHVLQQRARALRKKTGGNAEGSDSRA